MPTFHYYNGSNQNLCEEVIVDYVERTLADWTVNWTGDATFVDNVHGMMEFEPAAVPLVQSDRRHRAPLKPDRPHAAGEGRVLGPRARKALFDFGIILRDWAAKP